MKSVAATTIALSYSLVFLLFTVEAVGPVSERFRRVKDVDDENYFKNNVKEYGLYDEREDDDREDDDRYSNSSSSWSQAYDVMTLSTIPEVPSMLPGTLTTSAILEIGQPQKRTFGKSVAKTMVDHWRKQLSTNVAGHTKNSKKSDSKHEGNEEMHDFRYQQASVLRRNYETSSGYDKQSSPLSSTPTTDTPASSSPVDMVAEDHKRLAPLPAASKRKRKLPLVLVAVVVMSVVVTVVVAVVVSLVGKYTSCRPLDTGHI